MVPHNALKDLLSQDWDDREKVMVCLAVEPITPRRVKDITDLAFNAGWRQVKKKNISSILSRARGLVVRTVTGWELTTDGFDRVMELVGLCTGQPVAKTAHSLRSHLATISDACTRSFVEEAVACFEAHRFRAAVVLSWIGAVSLLQNYVVRHKLAEFNAEASKRNSKWKSAKSVDDIGLMKEDEFLDVLQAISVIGKNVKQELKKALMLRNGCGHPNSLKIGEHKVSSHVEDLMLNVFAVF